LSGDFDPVVGFLQDGGLWASGQAAGAARRVQSAAIAASAMNKLDERGITVI
jgi:hypothetical protein